MSLTRNHCIKSFGRERAKDEQIDDPSIIKKRANLRNYMWWDECQKKTYELRKCKGETTTKITESTSGWEPKEQPKICIIGAGIAGLFTALLLEKAGLKDIKILEYQGRDRVGGRIYTHYFSEDPNDDKRRYGEIGAMRLPQIKDNPDLSPHQLVFDSIQYLNENVDKEHQLELIDFIFSNDDSIFFYNNATSPEGKVMTADYVDKISEDPAQFTQLNFPTQVPSNYRDIFEDALTPFFKALNANFEQGLNALKQQKQHSVYSYLRDVYLPAIFPTQSDEYDEIISAMESVETSTGLFHLSLLETVIDIYTFSNPNSSLQQVWKTIDKGMSRYPNAFLYYLEQRDINIKFQSQVYKLDTTNEGRVKVYWKDRINNNVSVDDEFDAVVVTAALGAVSHWDLPANTSYQKRRAIRTLGYVDSVKIFLSFTKRFWEYSPSELANSRQRTSDKGIVGGTSSTDLSVRTVVYPSYYQGNANIPKEEGGVLLASYTWNSDAQRFSSLTEEECFEIALKDVVKIHGEVARECWIPGLENNKAHCWATDNSVVGGAFALFGPAQFETQVQGLINEESHIHWAGEHTDVHHGWIVAALNSAVRVTGEILRGNLMEDKWKELVKSDLLKNWDGQLDPME
ncbi:500_t:CDS:2 [Diversispora eburnea]|uniref:500_t:CDS:1 n=1 Tax=Diversispora eburnea TaxID=1213867 RepID=A0A9N8V0I3_9GLOM|nr:500_t:CDS:2 [Diversispora eburnea]